MNRSTSLGSIFSQLTHRSNESGLTHFDISIFFYISLFHYILCIYIIVFKPYKHGHSYVVVTCILYICDFHIPKKKCDFQELCIPCFRGGCTFMSLGAFAPTISLNFFVIYFIFCIILYIFSAPPTTHLFFNPINNYSLYFIIFFNTIPFLSNSQF